MPRYCRVPCIWSSSSNGGPKTPRKARRVRRSWRNPILAPALFLFLVVADTCFAAWNLTTPTDPNRSWGVSETTSEEYDDNWTSVEHNRETGFRTSSDVKFRASIPLERIFAGVNYDYTVVYPSTASSSDVNQTHNLGLSATYLVNPRLELSLSETFISSIEPGIVQQNGASVTLTSGGNYIYDSVGAGVSYQLAPLWTASLNGSWDIWQYQTSTVASNNNHQDYSVTASALYALDTRTTVGLNYQFSQDVYVNAGTNNGLNGYANSAYLSVVRRFNPKLSLTVNAGYTLRNSEDGSANSSPSGLASLTYNYGPLSTLAVTIAQSLTEATLGVTGAFSAQENTSFALQANHRITVRLRAVADASYVYTTFTAPLGGTNAVVTTVKPHEQGATGHIGLRYDFKTWLGAVLDYSHTQVVSSDSRVVQPYSRNQASVGITLTY